MHTVEYLKHSEQNCHRCQWWGHSSRGCQRPFKCFHCGGAHQTARCGNIPEYKICANCREDHPTNSRDCRLYKKYSMTVKNDKNTAREIYRPRQGSHINQYPERQTSRRDTADRSGQQARKTSNNRGRARSSSVRGRAESASSVSFQTQQQSKPILKPSEFTLSKNEITLLRQILQKFDHV